MPDTADFNVAILGAGPGGLSAGARAAQRGLRHVLLEAAQQHANTIQQYQLRKHVMAEPDALPLRSDLAFRAGRREEVLDEWQSGINRTGVNIRYGAAVTAIRSIDGVFHIELAGGEMLRSESVIVALGTQGNPRRLGVAGDDHPRIQASLADPDAYRDETILVVGAGDAAIENALALAPANRVLLVNRAGDFPRAKLANQRRIARAIETGALQCHFNSTVLRVEGGAAGDLGRCRVTLRTGEAEAIVECHRVITRLGSVAPRRFIEQIGVRYNSEGEQALPELSSHYESSVPGLYMIGALAGFPLIKQALNQGYEVIERLAGNAVDPADHGVLSERLRALPFAEDVEAKLAVIRERIGLLREVSPLTLRELVLASRIRTPAAGDEIFHRGDFLATAYNVLQGEVKLLVPDGPPMRIREGQLAGSISLVSGRPATATAIAGEDCVLLETPHRMVRRLLQAERGAREYVDQVYVRRALKLMLTPNASSESVHHLAESAEIVRLRAGEELFHEGSSVDRAYLIRKGSMTLSQHGAAGEVVVAYCAAGHYVDPLSRFGEGAVHAVTARATVAAEVLSLDLAAFLRELERDEALLMQLQAERATQLEQSARLRSRPEASDAIGFLMAHGVGEATNMLVIDDSLCIGCDQCETACASTHGGIARLERSAGPVLRALHLPVSCRHCEHPHCMSDCPVDAIHRQPGGEVTIADSCIGCGNCEENCPYGVIKMAEVTPPQGLISRLLRRQKPEASTLAVKCDLCTGLPAGPACVNACPTGAAIRIGAKAVVELTERRAALAR